MRLVTKPMGTYQSRGPVRDPEVIKFQGIIASAQSLEEAASLSLVCEALTGKGPLAKVLKTTTKEVVDKFKKQNPEFTFTVLGRAVGTKNKPDAAKTGPKTDAPAKAATKVPAKPKGKAKATPSKAATKPVEVPKKASKKATPVKKKAKK